MTKLNQIEDRVLRCGERLRHVDFAEIRGWNFCPMCGVAVK